MDITSYTNKFSESIRRKLNELAYKRLMYSREIEVIDKKIEQLEGAAEANLGVKKELETNAVVEAAKANAAALEIDNAVAEEAKKTLPKGTKETNNGISKVS